MTTPPPGATVVRVFEREPTFNMGGAIRSGGSIETVWATTATLEELIDWYTSSFGGTYEFYEQAGSDPDQGQITLADTSTPSGNSIRVRIQAGELTARGQTYNQQTHPGMTFVAASVGELEG